MRLRVAATADRAPDELAQVRALPDDAFLGEFTVENLAHGLGGTHWLIERGGRIVCPASVIDRAWRAGDVW